MAETREPRKTTRSIRRLRAKVGKDERFCRLVLAVRKAMVMHVASVSELRQATTLVAHEYGWALYRLRQNQLHEEPEGVLEEDDEEADDGGATEWGGW